MKKTYHIAKKDNNKVAAPMKSILICCCGFMIGCIFTASVILNVKVNSSVDDSTAGEISSHSAFAAANSVKCLPSSSTRTERRIAHADATTAREPGDVGSAVLRDLKILVVIAAFDFSQLPHLEEVIGAYHDLCAAGSHVDVMVHTTVAYPVTLIDLLNTRVATPLCPDTFSVTIAVKPKSLRLFLVDEHRKVFYDKIHQYDLFIYTAAVDDDLILWILCGLTRTAALMVC